MRKLWDRYNRYLGLGVVFVILLAAVVSNLVLARPDPGVGQSFARLVQQPVMAAFLALLIAACACVLLWSGENRRAHERLWGGIFIGLGLALAYGTDPALGFLLAMSGSMLAGPPRM